MPSGKLCFSACKALLGMVLGVDISVMPSVSRAVSLTPVVPSGKMLSRGRAKLVR